MSRNDTYLSLCLEQASLSSLHYRHGCIIVRGGKIIGKGYNDYRSGFNGGAQSTGKFGLHGPKQKNPQCSGTKKKSAGSYVAFDSQDHAIGTGGVAKARLAPPSGCKNRVSNYRVVLNDSLVYSTSKLTPTPSIRPPGTRPVPRWSTVSGRMFNRLDLEPTRPYNVQHEQAGYYNVEEEEERKEKKKIVEKRNYPGNNNVHHHAQINYLEFQRANAQKALRRLPSDDDEKHRRQYLYGTSNVNQYHHHHHSHHQKSTHPQSQQRHKASALVVPQNRIVTKSHQVAERMKDSRLKGADLYVARLGKTISSKHYDCGCQYEPSTSTARSTSSSVKNDDAPPHQDSDKMKPSTGSLHDELRFPFPSSKPETNPTAKPSGKLASREQRLTATHSRPCYRCISYMHSAGIKRVFWTNTKGEWEGGKVRDMVDALEGPVLVGKGGGVAMGDVYVTKSEVLLLKGLR
ncbi:MAG: hypothetical protein Q9169_005448 [Polycauliona sp. 2 TL-2023]